MNNRRLLIVVLLIFIGITLFSYISLIRENSRLSTELSNKTKKIQQLESQVLMLPPQVVSFQQSPSITYNTYHSKKRLVVNEQEVKLFPGSKAPKIVRTIEPYTVVDVLESGLLESEDRELWLYVSFPVYDTPMDNRGWIRESDTIALTENNRTYVRSDISLRMGTPIFEVDRIEDIAKSKPTELLNDVSGRIQASDDKYAYIQCGGGWSFWVEKKYLIYLAVD